jgi:hypothetical protein
VVLRSQVLGWFALLALVGCEATVAAPEVPQLGFTFADLRLEPRFYCGPSEIQGSLAFSDLAGYDYYSVGRLAAGPPHAPLWVYFAYLENTTTGCRFYRVMPAPPIDAFGEFADIRFRGYVLGRRDLRGLRDYIEGRVGSQFGQCIELEYEIEEDVDISDFPLEVQTCLLSFNDWLGENLLLFSGTEYGSDGAIGNVALSIDGLLFKEQ